MENTAYNTLQKGRGTSRPLHKKIKSDAKSERRMSVEEYFGIVLKKLDEHYAGLAQQEMDLCLSHRDRYRDYRQDPESKNDNKII